MLVAGEGWPAIASPEGGLPLEQHLDESWGIASFLCSFVVYFFVDSLPYAPCETKLLCVSGVGFENQSPIHN